MSKRMILLRYKCDETHSSAMITRKMSLKHVFEISTSIAEEPLIKDLAGKAQESSSTEFHLDHIYANCIDVHPIKKTNFHSEY